MCWDTTRSVNHVRLRLMVRRSGRHSGGDSPVEALIGRYGRLMVRCRTSRWLRGAAADAGLLIPGSPSGRSCDLLLAPDFVVIQADDVAARLHWRDFSTTESSVGAEGRWCVTRWSFGRGGDIGVGIALEGCYVDATEELRRRRWSLTNRINRSLESGVVAPLCAIGHISRAVDADRAMVSVLCSVLAERPAARQRLDDARTVRRLIDDMVSQPHAVVPFVMGSKRRTVEILTALRSLGYEHRLGGRPLPDEKVPTLDELVPLVLAKVRASPYAQGLKIDHAMVRDVVNRRYVSINPWPVTELFN